MKLRYKIVSVFVALLMCTCMLNIPSFFKADAVAATNATISSILNVKNIDEQFDIESNSAINFYDYCKTANAEVIIYKPEGKKPVSSWQPVVDLPYYFITAGIYAVQFRVLSGDFYNYSEVYYIPVSNSFAEIELNSELKEKVKPGTVVTIPTTDATGVTVKVFSPYGEEIEVSNGKFTNKSGVLGKYYIEYSKNVDYNGDHTKQYIYEIIEFSLDSTETDATVSEDEEEDKEEKEYAIDIKDTGLENKDNIVNIFKYYDVNGAVVTKPDGSIDGDAEVYLTIFDKTAGKYFNFSTSLFETMEAATAKTLVSNAMPKFITRNIDDLKSMDAMGHEIVFTYTSTVNNKDLEKTLTLKEKFDFSAITIKSKQLSPSELTEVVISETDVVELAAAVDLSGLELVIQDGYDKAAILELVENVEVTISSDIENDSYKSSDTREANAPGIDVVLGATKLDNSYKFYYNKNMKAEKTYNVSYVVSFADGSASNDNFNGTKSYEFKMKLRPESQDSKIPHELEIGSYVSYTSDTTWTVPFATAKDLDDNKANTTGVRFEVYIKGTGSVYSTEALVEMGTELTGLVPGVYTVRYVAYDYVGNKNQSVIKFKVLDTTSDVQCPDIVITNASYELEDDKYTFEISSSTDKGADYVLIYKDGEIAFNPDTTIQNGSVSGFVFENDNQTACVAVLVKVNSYGKSYVAIKVQDCLYDTTIGSYCNVAPKAGYKTIAPCTDVKVDLEEKVLWTGSSSFEIKSDGGRYTIYEGNEITFLEAGKYTILSVEDVGSSVEVETKIEVTETKKSIEISSPTGYKQVAKKGDEINISRPVSTNYFGYDLEIRVFNSAGLPVETVKDSEKMPVKFTAEKADEYTVAYLFSLDGVDSYTEKVVISTGNTQAPSISISGDNEPHVWTGDKIKVVIQQATAVDKHGNTINVDVLCEDANGQSLEIKSEDGYNYVEVVDAGIYTVYYTAIDADGVKSIAKTSFVIEFPEQEDEDGLGVWAIIGIVAGGLAVVAACAFVVRLVILNNKKKSRFINKAKQEKKRAKKEEAEGQVAYTIAESKDEKHWTVKRGNKQIAKCTSKAEAVEKAKEDLKKGQILIKVYNKNGRLIDSI